MRVAIIGAGAAGCFCAAQLSRMAPSAEVVVYESGNRPLAKVAITGGGRCNLTNSFRRVEQLGQVYPRGERLIKKLFNQWNHENTMEWFENEGVRLVTQEDECVFPESQDAMQIVRTLLYIIRGQGVQLHTGCRVAKLLPQEEGVRLTFADEKQPAQDFDYVVVTIGGCPTMRQLSLFDALQLEIASPVPSLFTFNIADTALRELMGCVVEDVSVSLTGTKFQGKGPLLVTHWGVSGPAILKLSSHAARYLAEHDYRATLCVNWYGEEREEEVRQEMQRMQKQFPQRLAANEYPQRFTARLWQFLLQRSGIDAQTKWCDVAGKRLNKLVAVLTSDTYPVEGKSKYKEEFVTCGGVALGELQGTTMHLRRYPQIYLAGEVLDVDAVTGGFNLQAAWTMAHAVATDLAQRINA